MGKRRLSEIFMHQLTHGWLAPITQRVVADPDLDLFIRRDYVNIYFKGNSLLRLAEAGEVYRVTIHNKFVGETPIPDLVNPAAVRFFLQQLPHLKERIIEHGRSSIETEYEQALIRANNLEPHNNSDYFIVDRQYRIGRQQIDLLGIYWEQTRRRRQRGQTVQLCLMELKYALNPEIKHVAEQIAGYYEALEPIVAEVADECEALLRQRLALGLYDQPAGRLEAMGTLRISRQIEDCQIIVVLIDYNPRSSHYDPSLLERLPFRNQIRVLQTGLAMWETNLKAVG